MGDFSRLTVGGYLTECSGEGSLSNSTHPIDATNDAIHFVFQMPEAATITKACFKYGFRGAGTPVAHRISLQAVSATTGIGDGTVLGGGTPASVAFTPPASSAWDDTWRTLTLDNSYTCTRGQFLAVVIEPTGTPSGAHYGEFVYGLVSNGSATWANFPYVATVNAGATTKHNTRIPCFSVESSTKTYGRPAKSLVSTAHSSDSTPDEYALRFVLDSSWGATYTIVGVRFLGRAPAVGKTLLVSLYSGTTAQQTMTLDTDAQYGAGAGSDRHVFELYFDESSLTTLNFGDTYRIGFAPQETASNFALASLTLESAQDLTAYPGGSAWYQSTRTDSGAWTDSTTQRPLVELIIADWTEPSGGGGMLRHGGMTGGLLG